MKKMLIAIGAIFSLACVAHADDTNCKKTGVDQMLANEYSQATHAWCQNNSKATYMVVELLRAISEKKARFYGGSLDLAEASGFTAIALGGYKLESGMYHRRDGKKYVTVLFSNTDGEGRQRYRATYEVDESVFGSLIPKK